MRRPLRLEESSTQEVRANGSGRRQQAVEAGENTDAEEQREADGHDVPVFAPARREVDDRQQGEEEDAGPHRKADRPEIKQVGEQEIEPERNEQVVEPAPACSFQQRAERRRYEGEQDRLAA